MNVESLTPSFERPFVDAVKAWPEYILTLLLLVLAGFMIWVALQKDHAVLKAVLLGWIVLP